MITLKPSRTALIIGIPVIATAALVAALVAPSSASASSWAPSASEVKVANQAAHIEAASTIPGSNGSIAQNLPTGTWPSNVRTVQYAGMTRKLAESYLDGFALASGGGRSVVCIRMTGQFAVQRSGPQGSNPVATGTIMTIIVDSQDGSVLDFGLDTTAPTMPASAATVYGR